MLVVNWLETTSQPVAELLERRGKAGKEAQTEASTGMLMCCLGARWLDHNPLCGPALNANAIANLCQCHLLASMWGLGSHCGLSPARRDSRMLKSHCYRGIPSWQGDFDPRRAERSLLAPREPVASRCSGEEGRGASR